ncbi:transposase [Streptomyces sp. NPDC002580]|uniref:transposase n=1 Tax=Streptomyces sp. NPDC002580 TaxID=3364653 RepID=UPI0036C47C2F
MKKLAVDLGVHPEALRGWIRQAEADAGEHDDRLTTDERAELAVLAVLAVLARRTSSSSGRTRFCERLRRFSRRSSTRPGPGDGAR